MKKISLKKREMPDFLEVDQLFCYVNKKNDVNINGSVIIKGNDYNDHQTIRIYANLCNDEGSILLVMNNFKDFDLEKNYYYSFEMLYADVTRVCDLDEIAYAEIYIVFDERI